MPAGHIAAIYISPGHNYFGRWGQMPGTSEIRQVTEVECVAGAGLVGDRFFKYKPDYKGQITFFAKEIHDEICDSLGVSHLPPSIYRRNVITLGLDLNALIDKYFRIQGCIFRGTSECKPCAWMDQAVAPGAEAFLKGRGGLRATIRQGGILRCDVKGTA
ncbi:molybdenum cofactor biosysynthesis protein [Verrucomicrobia bacterium LW23]|nr:molybdenum cofactor biosysynthesis protein [Verrucomicrobia bacterium LW23]